MGLLDGLFDSEQGRMGLGLLAAGSARGDGAGFGQRLSEAVGSVDQWKKAKAQAEYQKQQAAAQQQQMAMQAMQMQQYQAQAAQQQKLQGLASQFATPATPMAADGFGPSAPASFDRQGYASALEGLDPMAGLQYASSIQKQGPKLTAYKPGDSVRDESGREVFNIPKEVSKPSEVQEYEYAKSQGYGKSFNDFRLENSRAKGTNVSMKVDNKMGESLAGQVGPMVKDTYTQAQGAIQQADAANRIIQAVDSGKIIAGPLAGGRMKVAQIGQMLGVAGKDEAETIARSRDVIRGLSELTLQGRKQMTGQGAITESEGKLAEKAMSGDIADLTPAEIKQLAAASARVAKYNYDNHQGNLQNLQQDPNTAGLAKFYKVGQFPNVNVGGTQAPAGVINFMDLK